MIDASERPEIDPGDRFQCRRPGMGPAAPLPQSLVTPGMSAAVEIKTGKRSVLSFLLSPIARSVSEAGRER